MSETALEGWPFDNAILIRWIRSQMLDMFHAEQTGEMIWGADNYELVYEEDAIWIYPAKGYFPRDRDTFGATYNGDGIKMSYSSDTIKLRKVIDDEPAKPEA